jgi:hypothetical protein
VGPVIVAQLVPLMFVMLVQGITETLFESLSATVNPLSVLSLHMLEQSAICFQDPTPTPPMRSHGQWQFKFPKMFQLPAVAGILLTISCK